MQIPEDDQQFEAELRRLAPREVAPFPARRPGNWRWRSAVAATILAMVGMVLWHLRRTPGPAAMPDREVHSEVTLGRAQAAVTQASSWEEAIDHLEQESRASSKPKGHGNQSALAALGKEDL